MAQLREQKKQRVREAIQREGLRLITAHGYDSTTCEQIAAAAEVSPATLFRYFPTKEDIVLDDVYDPLIATAVQSRPAGEGWLTAVRRGLAQTFAAVYDADVDAIRQRTALVLSVPALRARSREQLDTMTAHLAAALAERSGLDPDDLTVRASAAACAAATATAVERWSTDGGDLPALVDQALVALGSLRSRADR